MPTTEHAEDDLPERPRSAFAARSLSELAQELQDGQAPQEDVDSDAEEVSGELVPLDPRMEIDPDDPDYFFMRDKNGRRIRRKRGTMADPTYWTQARKDEQRAKVKAMMAEGKFGGQNGFGRRKTKPFQQIVAEKAQARADDIVNRLEAMIYSQTKDKRLQLEAIRELAKFESWAVQNSREDEREFRAMTNQQLDERLLMILGEAIGFDFTVVEGTAEEVDPDLCPDCVSEAQVMERMLLDERAPAEMVERLTSRARCALHRDLGQIGAAHRNQHGD